MNNKNNFKDNLISKCKITLSLHNPSSDIGFIKVNNEYYK